MMLSNVQEVDLELRMHDLGKLPRSLFSSKTLVVLRLCGAFLLNVPFDVSLPSLKSLYLESINYKDDASIKRLLSSCHVLEELIIPRFGEDNVWTFDVSVPSLKRLTGCDEELYDEEELADEFEEEESVGESDEEEESADEVESADEIEEEASKIEEELVDEIETEFFDIEMFTSTKLNREWEVEGDYGNSAYGLLRSIANAKRLSLSGLTLQGITNPLEQESNVDKDMFFKYHWMPPTDVSECVLLSLKKVEIHYFCGKQEEELKLAVTCYIANDILSAM
ncbi:hypothetical protein RJ639_043153 [Escallonia herrerae]|uniref:Uncharacterized protein n=1 Tax=Escallonia herrerae TaxID=1293975 RepID=A0AA88WB01_9ASTE|nr:hypothetical protein RJ639_043153 [Escallonia herrerae]